MSRKPPLSEIAAFLAEVKRSTATGGDPADLAGRKADLLERIAAADPGDTEAAAVARSARAAADRRSAR